MGFTLPHTVAGGAVRSYRTLSPLPTEVGGLLSAALSVASPRLAVSEHAAVGVRTFLPHPRMAATVLASSISKMIPLEGSRFQGGRRESEEVNTSDTEAMVKGFDQVFTGEKRAERLKASPAGAFSLLMRYSPVFH